MASTSVRDPAPDPSPAPASTSPLKEVGAEQAPASAPRTMNASRTLATIILLQARAVAAAIVTFVLSLILVIAPLAALIVAIWSSGSALVALARLIMLMRAGQALTSPAMPTLLDSLDTAARVGFLATGYLALIFALITLMAGLFGRGWGRLFVLPGATFTLTALALMVIGALFAAPLANDLPIPAAWLIPLVVYALIDAVLVSGVLIDARLTRSPSATGRHRAMRRRRAALQWPRESDSTPV